MSQFYAEIRGNRGSATRMGSKKSGLWAHIRGWHVGVKVYCQVNAEGKDEIQVYKTGGSTDCSSKELIAHIVA